jgi:hypothetical protein
MGQSMHLTPGSSTWGAVCCAPVIRILFHFTLLGTALFAFDRAFLTEPPAPYEPPPVVVPAARVAEMMRSSWMRGAGPPTDEELRALAMPEVNDELLYREAIALGFDRDDPVIFNRLVMNMRFAGAGEDEESVDLYEQSRELGMHLTDIVVRRRLVQRMRLLIESRAASPEPTEEELRAYFAERTHELLRPARVRIVHRYFTREHAARAESSLNALAGAGPEAGSDLADAFLHPPEQPPQSERELANRFGAEFATGVFALVPGEWAGPVNSAYGAHLVYVKERTEEEPLTFEEVRDQMRYGLLADRGAEALADILAKLREGVDIQVERPTPS